MTIYESVLHGEIVNNQHYIALSQ